jgi:hypothetical protein
MSIIDLRPRPEQAPEQTAPVAETAPKPTVLDQVGGVWGFVYATVPVLVFVVANSFVPLLPTIAFSMAAAFGMAGWRVLRGEKVMAALGGVFGVAAAAGMVAWTGSPKDFVLLGIWFALAGAVVLGVSLLARRPLTGLVWNAVHGGQHAWRDDRPTLRAHDLATLAAFVVFAGRFVVKQFLYVADATGGLAVAKIAMGTPLTVVLALVVIWAFRRSTKRLLT